MIVGYFDFTIIGILAILIIRYRNHNIDWKQGCLMNGIIFGFFLPIILMGIELTIATEGKENIDNFTLLYTYLKFPIYWMIGIVLTILIGLKNSKTESD